MHNRGIPNFRRNFFVSVPKKFLGEPYCAVSENFRSRKSLFIRGGGGVSRFSVEIFLSHSAEKLRKGTI